MAAAASSLAPESPPVEGLGALFAYKATRDGRTIMELLGFEGDDHEVRVEAEIHSVRAGDEAKAQQRSLVFPTRELARKFADEALITFEYMGCTVKNLAAAGA